MEITARKEQVKKGSIGLTFALMTGYSMAYMDKNMVSTAMLPIASEFHLDAGQTGIIMSIFFLGYSLMQIPGGWLADRFGAKKVLLTSLFLITLFSLFFGIAGSLILFLAVRFCVDVGHAGYPPSCSKAIADNFVQEKRTFIQALMLSTSGIGGILAFVLGANVIAVNWRYAYFMLAGLFFTAFILVFIFVPNVTPQKVAQEAKIKFTQVLLNRNILVLCVAMFLLNFLLYGNISWLPSYLSVKFHLSISQVGVVLAINAVFQTIATIFTGRLVSKLFLGKEKLVSIIGVVLTAILIIGFVLSNNMIFSIILLIFTSMISVSAFTTLFTLPHKLFDKAIIGSSIGIMNSGGTLGGFFAPMILGFLIKVAGGSFTLAFMSMAVAAILCGISVLFIKQGSKA